VADSVAEAKFEAQKRRSTRLQQSVPLTVSGVDALGRSFQERTSTVVVNCHGCRYQSKHYVLKNTWVTLEVSRSEPGEPPRAARARVAWIQRPRTVRDLFQIGVELEVAGNLWGTAFSEPDWFPFPDNGELLAPSRQHLASEASSASHADNLRVLPLSSPPESLADGAPQRQFNDQSRLDLDLTTAAREALAQVAAAEAPALFATLRTELDQAAQQSLQALADSTVREARSALETQLAEAGKQQEAEIRKQLETSLRQANREIQHVFQNAQASLHQTREAVTAAGDRGAALANASIQDMQQRFGLHAEEASREWNARLQSDITAASDLWHQRIENSLESAAQKAAERLACNSQAAADRIESAMDSRFSSLGKAFAEVTNEAEQKLNALRGTARNEAARAQSLVAQLQSATFGVDEHAARLEAVTRGAHQELQRRAATVLEAQSRELAHRSESILADCIDKLEPGLESAGQQAIARMVPQIDQELAARLKPAQEVYARIEANIDAAGAVLRHQQEELARSSDQAVEITRGRLQETIDRLSREYEGGGRAASAKWLAEIEARATETTHSTFESLYKSADWYEKKVQTQMQATVDKGLEQATSSLRDKAGEVSRLFASELDHYSRSYVEHVHGQIEETSHDLLDRTQRQFSELSAGAASSFAQHAEAQTEASVAHLHERSAAILDRIAAHVESHLTKLQQDIAEESSRRLAEFQREVASSSSEAFAAARQDLIAHTESSLTSLRNERHALQAQLTDFMATAAQPTLEEYKRRLEAASTSWLLTTVSRLDQQSHELIRDIAENAREQLRQACAQVFADAGNQLRQPETESAPPPAARIASAGA
jgi:hypothetical protein